MPDEDGGIGLNDVIRGLGRPAAVSSNAGAVTSVPLRRPGGAFNCVRRG